MSGFFRKAVGMFVEIEEDQEGNVSVTKHPSQPAHVAISPGPGFKISKEDFGKFEVHFNDLLAKSNAAGPDYYEFWKMMETLTAHIADERARLSAVFASLSIQGLTKQQLVASAQYYLTVIEKDKTQFSSAVTEKSKTHIEIKKREAQELEKKIAANAELIQKLTKEITESQAKVGLITQEIAAEENKIKSNAEGYEVAYHAVHTKINTDITKIHATL